MEGQTKPPRRKEFRSISSGYTHTCALEVDGTPVCWGADLNGVTSPPKREAGVPQQRSGARLWSASRRLRRMLGKELFGAINAAGRAACSH